MHSALNPSGSREWGRGWPIVLGAATMFATGPGLYQNISSVFTPALEARFGWSRGDIATAAGIGLLAALAAPFIGRIVDRIGAVPVIVASALILGAAHAWLASMTGGLWQFQVGVGLLALSAPGLSALVFGKLIARRFDLHRGLALGVATSGISITTLLLPPLVAAVIAASDWRFGYLLLGGFALLVGLPVAMLAIRATRLEPLLPAHGPHLPHDAVPERAGISAVPGIAAADARRSGNFWRIALALLLINMATIGLVTQLVPFGRDRGLGEAGAALLVSAYALSQIAGRLGMGALVDRFPAPLMAVLACLVSALGFAILFVPTIPLPVALAATFLAGLMVGAENDLLPYLVARLFGLRAFAEIFGSLFMIMLFGTAIGIVGFGRLHDATGDYQVALVLAGLAMIAAAALLGSLRMTARAPVLAEAAVD